MASPLSMAAATLGSGGLGFAGSVFNSIVGNNYNKQALKVQQQENQKNRDFNAREAALARQYGLDVMHEQQEYNSASSQVQRLVQAGLNPALAYGQISDGSVSSPAASAASSNGALSPLPYQGFDPLSASSAALNFAKAKEAESSAREKYWNGTNLETFSKYADSLYSGQVEVNGSVVAYNGAQTKFTQQEEKQSFEMTKNLMKATDELQQRIDESKARISVLNEEKQIKHIEAAFKSEEMRAAIRKLSADAGLSEQQATIAVAVGLAQIGVYEADALQKTYLSKLYNEQVHSEHFKNGYLLPLVKANMSIQNGHMRFNFDSDASWRNVERGFSIFNSTVNSLTQAAGCLMTRGASTALRGNYTVSGTGGYW